MLQGFAATEALPPTPPTSSGRSGSSQRSETSLSSPPSTVEWSEAEQRALLAVEAFLEEVRRKSTTSALCESSEQVSAAVREMVEGYHKGTQQLHEENSVLREQLLEATRLVGSLSDRFAEVKRLQASWAPGRGNEEGEGERGSGGVGLPSVDAHDGVVRLPSPTAVSALLADYHKAHNVATTLEAELRQWKSSCQEIGRLLSTVTEENVMYRQELAKLRATSVSITQLQDMAQAKDKAEHELATMRLQTAKLVEQLDMEAELRRLAEAEEGGDEAEGSVGGARADAHVTAQEVRRSTPRSPSEDAESGGEDEDSTAGSHPSRHHAGLWEQALREVEEQAALAASHAAARERLTEVEARMHGLAAENAHLTAALAALKEEDALLRQDAQGLVYRNGVLSQQVASLLVKCENLRRNLKTARTLSPSGDRDRPLPLPAAPVSVRGRPLPSFSSSLSSSSPRRLDAARLASMASDLQQRRSVSASALMTPSGLLNSSRRITAGHASVASPAGGRSTSPGVDTTLPPGAPVPRAVPSSSSSSSLLSSGVLDVTFLSPNSEPGSAAQEQAPSLPSVEVEHGVRRSIAAYAPRRRSVALRNFGGAHVGVQLPCEPRLPASDQLSGVPLGRPSAYSVLDPVRGTVRRHSSDAALTLARPSSSASSRGFPPNTSRQPEQQEWGEMDEEEGSSGYLKMLDMVDADDKLDRFSVNSVAELVVRNQELVEQLYVVTQKLEKAEARLTCEGKSAVQSPEEDGGGAPRFARSPDSTEAGRPTADAGSGERKECLKRSRGEDGEGAVGADADPSASSSSPGFGVRIGATALQPPQREPQETDFSSIPSSSDIVIASQNALGADVAAAPPPPPRQQPQQQPEGSMREAPWANAVLGPQVLAQTAQDTVRQLMHAVLEQHETAVACIDESLSSSLLQLLAVKAVSVGSAQQRQASVLSEANSAVLDSLVSLCTSQAVTLAQQAVAMAAAEEKQQADTQRMGWDGAQRLLRQTAEELKNAIQSRRTGGSSGGGNPSPTTVKEAESRRAWLPGLVDPSDPSPVTGVNDSRQGNAGDLARVISLLQTAAEKEDTIQRVHTIAQARQRAFLTKKERKMARLAARTERAAAALAAMIQHQQQQQQRASALTGITATAGMMRASASPTQPVETLEPTHSDASPTPQPIVPFGTPTAANAGAANAAAPIDPLLLPGVRGEGTGAVISQSPYVVVTDDSAEDEDDDNAILRELRDRLALSQAQSERLAEELHAEKSVHVELYERMWKLELERDAAFGEKEDMVVAMGDMLSREEYERVIADLDAAKNGIDDREAQLAHAQGENSRLLTRIDLLQEQLSSHQQRQEHANAAKNEEIAHQRRELEDQNRRYGRLYAQNKQLIEEADQLRRDAEVNVTIAANDAETIRQLTRQLAEVKERFLSDDSTQAVLLALYPGDTVLAAHAALVRDLRADKAALEGRLHEAVLQAREAEGALADKDSALRRAVQERQAAEVRLQEVLLRHASSRIRRRGGALAESDGSAAAAADEEEEGAHRAVGTQSGALQAVGGADSSSGDSSANEGGAEEEASGSDMAVQVHTLAAANHHQQRLLAALQTTVESQATEIRGLRQAQEAWQEREAGLRRKLDLLGRDPISETARRYGLVACESFEAQVGELSERNAALQERVDGLIQQVADLEHQVDELQDASKDAERRVGDLLAAEQGSKAELAQKEEALKTSAEQLARLEAQNAAMAAELHGRQMDLESEKRMTESLQRRLESTEEALQQCRADREKFFRDSRALIGRIQDLQRDLTRSDEEKRAANAALSQGMLSSASHGRGGGGARGSSTARRYVRSASAFVPPAPASAAATANPGYGPYQSPNLSGNSSAPLTGDLSVAWTLRPSGDERGDGGGEGNV